MNQNIEQIWPRMGHSHPSEYRWRDKLEHEENPTKQGVLTNWIVQGDEQVWTWKESEQARATHSLESAGTKSEHKKNPSKQEPLTAWRM
jgi:hypothetical protein